MHSPSLNIALMSSQTNWGGGEQFVWTLGRGLIERGHEVVWFADKNSKLAERIRVDGFRLFRVPSRTPRPRDLVRIRRICRKANVQLIHANDPHALTWGSVALLGRTGIKRVGVKHTAFPIRSALRYNWMLHSLVCVSQAVRKLCIESGISEQIATVIHGGLVPPKVDRFAARHEVSQELGISVNVPIFSAVGSLIPCKAYHRLIEAAHHLRWHLSDFRVVICGDGPERESLERLIRKYSLEEKVKLLGFQESPERWIAGSNTFVHPSKTEGLSLVAIQAQMLRTPVIAADCDGLGEVMKNPYTDEELGWIMRGDDPSQLANLMMNTLNENKLRGERIRAAHASAMDRFHVDRMIDSFEKLYSRLVVGTNSQFTRQRAA